MKTKLFALFALAVAPVAMAQEPSPVETEVRRAADEVAALLVAGRQTGDEAVVECLGRRLSSLRILLEFSVATDAARREALVDGRDDLARRKGAIIAEARAMAVDLRAEADQCPVEEAHPTRLPPWWPCPGRYECDVETSDLPEDNDFGFDPPEASPFL